MRESHTTGLKDSNKHSTSDIFFKERIPLRSKGKDVGKLNIIIYSGIFPMASLK